VHLTLTDQGPDVLVEGLETDNLAAAEAITAFAMRHGLALLGRQRKEIAGTRILGAAVVGHSLSPRR